MRLRVAAVRNLLKVWLLLAAPAAAAGYAGWRLGGARLGVLFLGSVVLLGAALYWYADRIAMGLVGGRELLPGEAPTLHATVAAIAGRAGVVPPRLYLLPGGYPRALSAGRGGLGGSALAVSSGLLGVISPAELDGVVAHEIAHLRRRDTLLQTVVVILAAACLESSRAAGWFQRGVLFVIGPVCASFVHLCLSAKREFEADRFAASLCDSPHGLADALVRLEQAMELVPFEGSPATEPLYTTNPFAEVGIAALFSTHPPVGERVRRLRDLDPGWRKKLRAA